MREGALQVAKVASKKIAILWANDTSTTRFKGQRERTDEGNERKMT